MKSNTLGHRDYNEHTRKLVRSNSVPTHHVSNLLPTQGLETPGGYSSSQNDAVTGTGIGPGLGEFRTPQSTRSGAKISGLGSKDWAKSEPAHVSPLLILENALRLATGTCVCVLCVCMCAYMCVRVVHVRECVVYVCGAKGEGQGVSEECECVCKNV